MRAPSRGGRRLVGADGLQKTQMCFLHRMYLTISDKLRPIHALLVRVPRARRPQIAQHLSFNAIACSTIKQACAAGNGPIQALRTLAQRYEAWYYTP